MPSLLPKSAEPERPQLKICTKCKKAVADWVQSISYAGGKRVESQCYVHCEKCRVKDKKKRERAEAKKMKELIQDNQEKAKVK